MHMSGQYNMRGNSRTSNDLQLTVGCSRYEAESERELWIRHGVLIDSDQAEVDRGVII